MSPRQFEQDNQFRWAEFEAQVDHLEKGREIQGVESFPGRFRHLCQDLNLAQHRLYGARLSDRLNHLVIRGYGSLHRGVAGGWERFLHLLAVAFPQAVRREAKLFWFCMLLFWGPFLALGILGPKYPELTMAILGPEGMAGMDKMYGQDTSPAEAMRKEYGSNFMMFCFYIAHNVGIDFQIFAGGILGGLGSIFFMVYNGLHLGAAMGYVRFSGNPETFFGFVSGHAAPELMGLVIAGMAGLRLGLALVCPGQYTRKTALALAGKNVLPLLGGAAFLTVWAAAIEGFWSANPFSLPIKYSFGAVMWVLVLAYLWLGGRRARA